jgi:hypothetical protein
MSDYSLKRSLLQDKMNKMKAQEERLIKKRKDFFADLMERLDLLTVEDNTMIGLLLDFKEKLTHQPQTCNHLKKIGENFLQVKKRVSDASSDSTGS